MNKITFRLEEIQGPDLTPKPVLSYIKHVYIKPQMLMSFEQQAKGIKSNDEPGRGEARINYTICIQWCITLSQNDVWGD